MPNEELRAAAKESGIRLWRVAARLGIADSSFSRKLRFELSTDEKQKILAIIDELKTSG